MIWLTLLGILGVWFVAAFAVATIVGRAINRKGELLPESAPAPMDHLPHAA